MSTIIPKEQLSAYQRWELGSFGVGRGAGIELPTAEDLERLHQTAQDEGYAAGYAQGQADARTEAARLKTLADGLEQALERMDEAIAEDLIRLALAIAEQVMRQALAREPERLLPAVREAMASIVHPGSHPRLLLHPDDAQLARHHLAPDLEHGGWHLAADPAIERGGCRVESAGTQVDATLATRWKRIAECLGERDLWPS